MKEQKSIFGEIDEKIALEEYTLDWSQSKVFLVLILTANFHSLPQFFAFSINATIFTDRKPLPTNNVSTLEPLIVVVILVIIYQYNTLLLLLQYN